MVRVNMCDNNPIDVLKPQTLFQQPFPESPESLRAIPAAVYQLVALASLNYVHVGVLWKVLREGESYLVDSSYYFHIFGFSRLRRAPIPE